MLYNFREYDEENEEDYKPMVPTEDEQKENDEEKENDGEKGDSEDSSLDSDDDEEYYESEEEGNFNENHD